MDVASLSAKFWSCKYFGTIDIPYADSLHGIAKGGLKNVKLTLGKDKSRRIASSTMYILLFSILDSFVYCGHNKFKKTQHSYLYGKWSFQKWSLKSKYRSN